MQASKVNYIKVIERCKPEVLRNLLELLGDGEVEGRIFGKEEDKKLPKGLAVIEKKVFGLLSKEESLSLYKNLFKEEFFLRSEERNIMLEKVSWRKDNEYFVEFDGYSIKAFFYKKSEVLDKLFEISKKYEVDLSLNFRK
ncbi:MAG: hypothetical protein ACP5FX_02595 [Candidatus Micrarchaeia archaeon]